MYFYFELASFFLFSAGTCLSILLCLVLISCAWSKIGFLKRLFLKLNAILFFLVLGSHLNFQYKAVFNKKISFVNLVILEKCRVQNCGIAKVVEYEFKKDFYSPVIKYVDYRGSFIKKTLDKTSRDYFIPKIGELIQIRYLKTDNAKVFRKHEILFDSLKRRSGGVEVLTGVFSFVFLFLNIFLFKRVKRYENALV